MEIIEKTLSNRKLYISDEVMHFFKKLIFTHDFSIETGGIVVGEMKPLHDAILITEVSNSFQSDDKGRFHFNRKPNGHQEYMDMLWKESGYKKMYLGEWHTHNQKDPIPSIIDIENWKKIEDRNNVAPEMYFIIIGTQKMEIWNAYKGAIMQMKIGDVLR